MMGTNETMMNKTCELSLYELQRTKQDAITDNSVIAVSPRSLNSELMCPICLDMLKETMATKDCLHRFCSDCIITALRAGKKQCPTCRMKLISKRSLRRDPNFDLLISKIYNSRDEYGAHRDRVLENYKATTPNTVDGQGKSRKRKSNDGICPGSADHSSGKVVKQDPFFDEMEVIFKPHPIEMSSDLVNRLNHVTRFIKTSGDATVEHLSIYLSTRMTLELNLRNKKLSFIIYVLSSNGDYVALGSRQTLESINTEYWKLDKPIQLFYSSV